MFPFTPTTNDIRAKKPQETARERGTGTQLLIAPVPLAGAIAPELWIQGGKGWGQAQGTACNSWGSTSNPCQDGSAGIALF